jgi:hypothetical protein
MKNGKKFFDKFDGLNGVTFISINNYEAKTSGEIANHTLNVGISVENAKQTDLNRLNACTDKDVKDIATSSKIDLETVKIALAEMIVSATKNLSADLSNRTAQSQAQTDAYLHITSAIKMHKETGLFHIFGQHINKKVLVAGTYKSVNSSDKTLAKTAIKKHLDLRTEKFRTFIVENIQSVKMQGETLEIN